MKRLKALAIAAVVAMPAAAMAQVYYPAERITIYEYQAHSDFIARERGAIQSGGATPEDTELADRVAVALGNDPRLNGASATVSAVNGRVSISGLADHAQNYHAQNVASRVAGRANVSGELSSDLG
jgi:osmotically-inducible protein OsmY